MKTFQMFMEQANMIVPVSPFKVMPPMRKPDGSYNPAPKRYLIDPITGFGPGQFKQSKVNNKPKSSTVV